MAVIQDPYTSEQAGVTVAVAEPTGKTAIDTPNVTAAITKLGTALVSGPATLKFQDGTYQVDGSTAIIQSQSNFAVTSNGGTVLALAPNRAALPNNTTGDVFVIADSSHFTVSNITFDGKRGTTAPITPITAAITSGQPSVTIAAGAASIIYPGLVLTLHGGYGSGESSQSQSTLIVSSTTPGGGSGGGDLVTFTGNISNNYNDVNGTLVDDAYGPFACTGAYLSYYQPVINNVTAGRTVTTEDQQNGLHLMNCSEFAITGNTARGVWESPIKLGCGVVLQASTYGNSCYNGIVSNNQCYHGYDQGISVWISQYITVTSNYIDSPGWGGVVLTESDYCTVSDNIIKNVIYQAAGDAGGGVAVEGASSNIISGNVISSPVNTTVAGGISIQGWPFNGVWGLTTTNTNWPTLTDFVEQGTVGGTSIVISSTSRMLVGGRYSIFDGYRTEAVTCSSIIDGTHAEFTETLKFSHNAGLYVQPRISQENTVVGNVIDLANAQISADGMFLRGSVRNLIQGNMIRNWTNNGIDLNANSEFCAPSSNLCGDGSQVIGNTLIGGINQPLSASGVTHLLIEGNKIYGTPTTGFDRGINLLGVTDTIITGNWVCDEFSSDSIHLNTGGPSSINCSRLTISNNVFERGQSNGINANLADSCTFAGNICGSNVAWGISLTGCTNCLVDGNTCNSNHSGGITLANATSTGCSNCRVVNNTCREDGSGVNVTTGATFTSPQGIVESGNSNNNLFMANECDSNTTDQLTTVGAGSVSHYNILSGTISA